MAKQDDFIDIGAVHKLRHAEEGGGGGGGGISSVTMYALKHTSVWDNV